MRRTSYGLRKDHARLMARHEARVRKCRTCGLPIYPGLQSEHLDCTILQFEQWRTQKKGTTHGGNTAA